MLVNTSQGGGGGSVPSDVLTSLQSQIDDLQAQLLAYQLLSEKDQAGGYAALNAQRQLDAARIPSAPRWATARTLTLTGDATGSVAIDGSANATLTVDIPALDTLQGGGTGTGAIAAAISMSGYPPFTVSSSKNIISISQYATGFYRFDFVTPITVPYLIFASGTWTGGYLPHPTTNAKTDTHFTIGVWSDYGWISAEALDILIFTI
jgi:hypothetical protein